MGPAPARAYRAWGLRLESDLPLPCLPAPAGGRPAITLHRAPAAAFAAAPGPADPGQWSHWARLPDGSDYLRYARLFEFLVSPRGTRIACRSLGGSLPAFQTYLLGQVLSFALLKRGREPLHATAVVVDGGAVGFLGDTGFGKSSLGAAFLDAGYPLLTDDLLILTPGRRGLLAQPGTPRIKLFPAAARRLLGARDGAPMNDRTAKRVIPLGRRPRSFHPQPVPLRALYALPPPGAARPRCVRIRRLPPGRAFVTILRNAFNTAVVDPDRLQRQFDWATRLAAAVPVRALGFPRGLRHLGAVRDAILDDLS